MFQWILLSCHFELYFTLNMIKCEVLRIIHVQYLLNAFNDYKDVSRCYISSVFLKGTI